MPCLNEAETLAFCVRQAVAALHDNNVPGEVLVADNGSTDGSQQIATRRRRPRRSPSPSAATEPHSWPASKPRAENTS